MADSKDGPAAPKDAAPGSTTHGAAKGAPKGNPVFRMMGLPNFRLKLPSRNWMIFLTVVGSWTGAVVYDRWEKKRTVKKWSDLVSHLAKEPLPPNAMQRKLTIFLSAPPADGLLTAREHFHEYVKPVLASAGLDWDAVEGRREGDVRAGLAERIRKMRKLKGEKSEEQIAEDDLEVITQNMREKAGVKDWDGPAGDIVIGRNTWKEYIRGLHEGWLGPLDPPRTVEEGDQEPTFMEKEALEKSDDRPHHDRPHDIASIPTFAAEKVIGHLPHRDTQTASSSSSENKTALDDASPTVEPSPQPDGEQQPGEEKPKEESGEDSKPKKPKQPPPFISTTAYPSASLSPSIPTELGPSTTIQIPTILGFLNTPIRIYRYLNKRKVADEIGREVAAACFALYRPYQRFESSSASSPFQSDSPTASSDFAPEDSTSDTASRKTWEQESLLQDEEAGWHKSVRKSRDPEKESVWLDDMILDPRIAERMRRFYLDPAEEGRASRLKDLKDSVDEEGS